MSVPTESSSAVLGAAVTALFAWLGLVAVATASVAGAIVAFVQRRRGKAGRVNVALATAALALSAMCGASFVWTTPPSLRAAHLVGPVVLACICALAWLVCAIAARAPATANAATVRPQGDPMTNHAAEARIAGWIATLMKDGGAPLALASGKARLPVRVVPVVTSGPGRPDGLREDAPARPGFGFAVAEARLEIDATKIERARLDVAHEALNTAGMDDWMSYSHMDGVDDAAIAADPTMRLTFSHPAKGAGVLVLVLEALGVSGDDVTPAP